jgi:hypothetical protein
MTEIDPNAASSDRLNRRVFVGISAAATLTASAAAAQEPLGQTHPPLVAEDDPAIAVERVALGLPDATVAAYAAWPAKSPRTTPRSWLSGRC